MAGKRAPRADDTPDKLLEYLRRKGFIRSHAATAIPLLGGVSSNIVLIEEDGRRVVVKQALKKLRVKDEWFAGAERNRFEQAYMRFAESVVPGCVPRIVDSDDEGHLFMMEYLGSPWQNWKSTLLDGHIDERYAHMAGRMLTAIHRASWNNDSLRREFATTANFCKLRIEPYLIATGERNPHLQTFFETEAARLEHSSMALVHGDLSPKNILLNPASGRIALLDCEVAWFGDPAFDVAFLLTHFLLKSLNRPECIDGYLGLARAFLESYRGGMSGLRWSANEQDLTKLILMLLLARVDGKSPVEYLTDQAGKQHVIRRFVNAQLPQSPATFAHLAERWQQALQDVA